jgi:uncharacterized membrane protein SpoIIM required for sporulation
MKLNNIVVIFAVIGLGLVLAVVVSLYPFFLVAAVIVGLAMIFKDKKGEA